MKININASLILRICVVILLILFAWFFPDLLLYIFLAFIFALIGKPIAEKISSIKIWKFYIPHGISTLLTLIFFILVFSLLLLFFIPTLIREVNVISNINWDTLSANLSSLLDDVQDFLYSNNVIGEEETLVGIITTELKKIISINTFSSILGGVVSTTGSFFFGLFAVFFLTFFFIKDDIRIDSLSYLLYGRQQATRLTAISDKINNLLSRYFIGLLIEIASMITLLYIGLALFGIKGALLMAFFGGILNAIPYLGPVIGAICCCLLGIIDCISINDYAAIFPTLLKIAGTFVGANLVDNIVLQPVIYSQSVKAHPVEIFLGIIMGGSLAGIPGMLFAIPVYTMIRTVVIEIFNYVSNKESGIKVVDAGVSIDTENGG